MERAERVGADARQRSGRARLWSVVNRERKGVIGGGIVALALLTALAAPALAPDDPSAEAVTSRFAPPGAFRHGDAHLLGADNLGRDILSRTIYGARVSMAIGLGVILLASSFGSALGGIAGFKRGLAGTAIMRLVDFQLSFPFLLQALLFLGILGPGFWSLLVALTVALWANYARLVRGETLRVREMEFSLAARATGASDARIILSHVLPNVLPSILILATLDMAFVIIFESSLTFLGLGAQPPTPSWGVMLNEGRNYLAESPWMSLAPGVAIAATVMGINLLGDWLRERLDPTLRAA
jgi:peptide/nickel transport system permease protein